MAKTWTHPELGAFESDDYSPWEHEIDASLFARFRRGWNSRAKLMFQVGPSYEVPTPEMISLAQGILADHEVISQKVVEALWADFHGQGPDSGVWWTGAIDKEGTVDEMSWAHGKPKSAEGLYAEMRFVGLVVHWPTIEWKPRFWAELQFGAEFEAEHGVGVLTDGKKIIGLGFQLDVSPFGA